MRSLERRAECHGNELKVCCARPAAAVLWALKIPENTSFSSIKGAALWMRVLKVMTVALLCRQHKQHETFWVFALLDARLLDLLIRGLGVANYSWVQRAPLDIKQSQCHCSKLRVTSLILMRHRSGSFILLARDVTVPGEHLFEKYAVRGGGNEAWNRVWYFIIANSKRQPTFQVKLNSRIIYSIAHGVRFAKYQQKAEKQKWYI